MFDLFLNGLNILGSVASVISYVNGFALERDIRQIKASLQQIERINEELRTARIGVVSGNLVGAFLSDLSGFRSFGDSRDPADVQGEGNGRSDIREPSPGRPEGLTLCSSGGARQPLNSIRYPDKR